MKYTIEGFSQQYASTLKKKVLIKVGPEEKEKEIKIDCTDLVILRWFVDFFPNMKKMIIEGKEYAWLTHKKMLEDLPLLDISKRACIERMQKLVEFKILDYRLIKEGGTFSLYGFGENYINLIRSNDIGGVRSNDIGGIHSNDIGVYVQPDNKDNSIKDKSITHNINNDFSSKKDDSLQIENKKEDKKQEVENIPLENEYEKKIAFYHISKILKLPYGQPTPKHIEYSNKWLDELKLPDYKIIEAGNKCIESIGKINFAYIDKILTTPPKKQPKKQSNQYQTTKYDNDNRIKPSYNVDKYESWTESDDYLEKAMLELKKEKKKIDPIDTWDYLDSLEFEIT